MYKDSAQPCQHRPPESFHQQYTHKDVTQSLHQAVTHDDLGDERTDATAASSSTLIIAYSMVLRSSLVMRAASIAVPYAALRMPHSSSL